MKDYRSRANTVFILFSILEILKITVFHAGTIHLKYADDSQESPV